MQAQTHTSSSLSSLTKKPIFFITLYVLSIFIFAVIYTLFFPNDFYSSTAQHENEYKALRDEADNIIQLHIGGSLSMMKPPVEGKQFRTNKIQKISNLVFLEVVVDDRESFFVHLLMKQATSLNKDKYWVPYVYLLPNDDTPSVATKLLMKKTSSDPHIILSETEYDTLSKFYKYSIETSIGNKFGRMLYYSTVTITTLGFGDIVPTSDGARYLTALESFLGIVIIGFFITQISRNKKYM